MPFQMDRSALKSTPRYYGCKVTFACAVKKSVPLMHGCLRIAFVSMQRTMKYRETRFTGSRIFD